MLDKIVSNAAYMISLVNVFTLKIFIFVVKGYWLCLIIVKVKFSINYLIVYIFEASYIYITHKKVPFFFFFSLYV